MFLPAALVVASLLPAQLDHRLRVGLVDPAPKFELQDGDRIVWIGSTIVEREQRYGYWETALHAAFPDKQFTLRNLGWSGDTVYGDARAGFENAAKGFERLVSLTLELKPTVIFVSYGTNESFEGEAGLPNFEKGLEKLLDALKPSKARVVLFTPLPFQEQSSFVDAKQRDAKNQMLKAYTGVIEKVASKRELLVVNLFDRLMRSEWMTDKRLTDNGMHLNGAGYLITAAFLIEASPKNVGLWADTLTNADPLIELRKAIVAKNELFFHRWRPENETYLLGFRKHEQGNNAVEIKQFEPLVAKSDEEIETIRKTLNK